MKRTAFALLAAASLFVIEGWHAPVAHATAPTTWTVQPGEGTAIAPAADVKPAEAQRFAVVATAKLGDAVLGQAVYPDKDFDSEAACKAALDGGDAELKAANDGLKARIEAKIPGAEVSFQCVAE